MTIIRFTKYAVCFLFLSAAFVGGIVAGQAMVFPAPYVSRLAQRVIGHPIRENQNRSILKALYEGASVSGTLFIGDSHIQYGDWSHLSGRLDVYAQGIAGETSRQILDRIKSLDGNIEKIVISSGTNDIDNFQRIDFAKNIQEMINTSLLKSKSVIFVAPPLTLDVRKNLILNEIIDIEKNTCAGAGCEFVDCNNVIAPGGVRRPETAVDYIHLSSAGYREIYACLRPYLFR